LNSAASEKKPHSTLQSEGKSATSRNLLNVVTALGVLDEVLILQQIQTITEHPKTIIEPTPDTVCI
jgi:hypothetical protein